MRNNQFLLQSDEDFKQCFPDPPRIAFRRPKNLKDHLVRAKLYQFEESPHGCSGDCPKCRSDCQIGDFLETTTTFKSKHKDYIYDIRVGLLHCNSKMVIYLLTCKTCNIQYVGKSVPPFRARFNNYRTKYRKYLERKNNNTLHIGKPIPQSGLFAHFAQEDHHGFDDWSFVLIDRGFNDVQLRKKECFWQYKLNVFEPEGLNVRDVQIILD